MANWKRAPSFKAMSYNCGKLRCVGLFRLRSISILSFCCPTRPVIPTLNASEQVVLYVVLTVEEDAEVVAVSRRQPPIPVLFSLEPCLHVCSC